MLTLVALVLAQAPTASPEARLSDAQAALDALRLEDAEADLSALVADPAVGDDVRARAWLTLGLARASLLDENGARVAFAAALAIDSTLTLPAGSSPKILRLFEDTRSRLPAPVDAPREERAAPTPPPPPPPEPARAAKAPAGAPGGSDDDGVGVGAAVTGAALVAVAAAAAAAALVADNVLGAPVAGRTRDEYEAVRAVGIAGVVGAFVFGIAGAGTLAYGMSASP